MNEERKPTPHGANFDQREGTPDSQLQPNPVRRYPTCDCLSFICFDHEGAEGEEWEEQKSEDWGELKFHADEQGRNCDALSALEDYIDAIATEGGDEFDPKRGIGYELWGQIKTLPASIAKLQSVKRFALYGSALVRIPPEIGELSSLEEFTPYTSYRLHWFPYEITRCRKLERSTVSTRALYGNYKHRPPFPRLPANLAELAPRSCSVCSGPFRDDGPLQVWISLRVARDVLPLLVHACRAECISRLPKPAQGYIQQPHRGGLELDQPPANPMGGPRW